MADLVSFMYSDDGRTHGRLTDDGIELVRILKHWREADFFERLARSAWYSSPAGSEVVVAEVDGLLRRVEQSDGAPDDLQTLEAEFQRLHGCRWQCFRYPALSVALPEIAPILEIELSARQAALDVERGIRPTSTGQG